MRQLEARVKAGHEKLTGTRPQGFDLSEWKRKRAAWPLKQKRQLLSAFIERVTINEEGIELSYLLSDSCSQDVTQLQQTNPPTNHLQTSLLIGNTQYIRLPKQGQLCPVTGLSRAKMNELILPNERNHFNPPVASRSLRPEGALKGVRLVLLESLLAFLAGKV